MTAGSVGVVKSDRPVRRQKPDGPERGVLAKKPLAFVRASGFLVEAAGRALWHFAIFGTP